MLKIWTVTKNELIRYFVSPLAYVYLFCFVVLNASFATYFGDFFNRGQADLQSMFIFQPWLYLLFIPGISMRLWAEEFHSKTIVQIVTQPISITSLVLGKFFAAWLFCGLALLLTFPFWITVNVLGHPDNFVIFMGYCASFMLAGSMLAVSQIMSALTKNQIIALVLSVIANLVFFWSGIEYVLAFCRMFLPNTLVDVVASFSFLTHFDAITYGLLDARDVIFFASLIIFCLFTTVLIINFKTAGTSGWLKSNNKAYTVTAWLMLFFGFFGLNTLANNLTENLQFDGTEEKNYTLTSSTKDILRNMPEPVVAKLYFSPILEQRNSDLRQQFNSIRMLLHKYKTASKGKFDYKIYYPEFLSKEEDLALADGLQAIPLIDLNQTALFGLTLEDTLQNKDVIPFFATTQVGRLEQDISAKLHQMYAPKKKVGIISGLPIFGRESDKGEVLFDDQWEIVGLLAKDYKLVRIKKTEDFDKHKFDVLLIIYPKFLAQETMDKIEEYSRNGGKAILILDPANEASRIYAPVTGYLTPSDSEFFEKLWSFKFYKDHVVADLQNSIVVDATESYTENPTFSQDVIQFKIRDENMNPKHPITQHLQEIMMASASVIMPDMQKYKDEKIRFYPLLRAGKVSEIMTSEVVVKGLNPQSILEYFEPDDNQKILAAEIIGNEPDNLFDVIVVGDSDFLYDKFWMEKTILLESEYVSAVFDNANFLLNALDYLTNDASMLGLRGKRALNRRFEDIEMLRRWNALQYKQRETQIFSDIKEAKDKLQEVWTKKEFEGRENFSSDELAALSKLRSQLAEFKKQLSNLRGTAYDSIKSIAARVNFINIWALPLLAGIGFTLWLLALLVRKRRLMLKGFGFNRRLAWLCVSCLIILICALISVYITNYSSIDAYENKLVFPQLSAKLNDVNQIVLKTNKQELKFVYKDELWQLEGHPYVPVYQERIRRLLTMIADARYFARKSDKAENLALFDLLPIEDEASGVTKVSLQKDDEIIQQFLLGDIDIDVGRGSKAAYMRFEDQFQVWEIAADFVDMDLDWHKWTYSHLWDLRFGRPYDITHSPENETKLVNLMKLLLNVPFNSVEDTKVNEPVKVLKMFVEGGNYVLISFHRDGDKAYVTYGFDKNNPNEYLKLFAQFIDDKAAFIDADKMEKLLEFIE